MRRIFVKTIRSAVGYCRYKIVVFYYCHATGGALSRENNSDTATVNSSVISTVIAIFPTVVKSRDFLYSPNNERRVR